ncbi:hypothetical protein KCU81_g10042, partial [Aureobasidium melanogenum]
MLATTLLLLICELQAVCAITRFYNLTLHSGVRSPDGYPREVYLINDQQPGPLIEANQGDTLEVTVFNNLTVENTIHWHAMQFPIPAGGNFTYRMPLGDQYGFYWYHSHFKTYYDDAVRGPLLIHPSPSLQRPFESLAKNATDLPALLQAERNATPVLLADWYHNLSNSVYQEYMTTGAFPNCVDSLLANGRGRVQCLPDSVLMAGPALEPDSGSMNMSSTATSPEHMSSTMTASMSNSMGMPSFSSVTTTKASMSASMSMMERAMSTPVSSGGTGGGQMQSTALNALGCTPPMMFNPGYSMDSLPAVTCNNTSSPLLTIPANYSQGWLALHLVNAAATSKLRVSLDAHSMFVFAADGLYVEMQEVKVLPISIGQRYSVMIRLDQKPGKYYLRFASYPVGDMQQVIEDQAIIQYDASCTMTAIAQARVLNEKNLAPLNSNTPPSSPADLTKVFTINQTDPVVWVVDKYPYSEPQVPVIYGNSSDGWTANTTIHMPYNATIDVVMQIANDSMDVMGHPMHLHGHKFWVLGSGSGPFPYSSVDDAPRSAINLQNPPYRDTVELPASGWVVIR